MGTEMVDKKPTKARQLGGVTLPQVEHDPLPCPRCESNNTKFCYYNNYNFSQPRHFCKACRRYWTQGGTLRDIPIGGGTRKTAKRCRTTSSSTSSSMFGSGLGSGSGSGLVLDPIPASQVFVPSVVADGTPVSFAAAGGGGASFSSFLSNSGSGILGLSGFGLGLGLDDVGFGLQRGGWAFPEVGYVNAAGGGASGGINGFAPGGVSQNENVNRGDTWQSENGENGFDVNGGDCFLSLPVLAISTPGNTMK